MRYLIDFAYIWRNFRIIEFQLRINFSILLRPLIMLWFFLGTFNAQRICTLNDPVSQGIHSAFSFSFGRLIYIWLLRFRFEAFARLVWHLTQPQMCFLQWCQIRGGTGVGLAGISIFFPFEPAFWSYWKFEIVEVGFFTVMSNRIGFFLYEIWGLFSFFIFLFLTWSWAKALFCIDLIKVNISEHPGFTTHWLAIFFGDGIFIFRDIIIIKLVFALRLIFEIWFGIWRLARFLSAVEAIWVCDALDSFYLFFAQRKQI